MGGAKFGQYYGNPYFQMKMSLLFLVGVHALVFRRSVYGNTEAIDRAPAIPGVAKLAACLSLALWLGIMSCGRWIAYYERPEDKGPVPEISSRYERAAEEPGAAAHLDTQYDARRKELAPPAQMWATAIKRKPVVVSKSSRRITNAVIPSVT